MYRLRQFTWKLAVVAVAGLIGGLLFYGLGVFSGILSDMQGHAGWLTRLLSDGLWILGIVITSLVGHDRSEFFLCAVFGAAPLMVLAALWQFIWKPLRELHERNYARYRSDAESSVKG